MDRLTEFYGGIWGLSVKAAENGYDRYSVYSKLAAYEDIGPTPEQLLEIDKMYADMCREVAELKKRDKSISREVIHGKYHCPICGKVFGPGYCNNCGQKLY